MKVLVTGHKGFVGKKLVEKLKLEGNEVIGYDIVDEINYEIDYDKLNKLISECDKIVHLASMCGLDKCIEKPLDALKYNIECTARICEMCVEHKKELIYISTWAVRGNLINPYDITKRTSEDFIRSYHELKGLQYTILRFGTLYGPGMNPIGAIPTFINAALSGKEIPLHGNGSQIRQWTHVDDVVNGISRVVKKDAFNNLFYLVAHEAHCLNDIIKMIAKKLGVAKLNVADCKRRIADESYQLLTPSASKTFFGWKPQTPFEIGFNQMWEYYKNDIL